MDPDRRALLTGAFLRRSPPRRSPRLPGPRPPVLLDEPAVCAGCETRVCATACGEGIVAWDEAAKAPYLDFTLGGCTFCGECVRACPHAAEAPPLRRLGTAVLDAARCMAWNGVVCMSCRFPCRERAIMADGRGRPVVIESRCTGCGACIGPCPVAAMSVQAPGAEGS